MSSRHESAAWNPESAEYAETIAAYDVLLSQPRKNTNDAFAAQVEFSLLSMEDSELSAPTQEVLSELGFRPVVLERSRIPVLAVDVVAEIWGDSTGGTLVELSRGKPLVFVSTYFVDGTMISVSPSDAAWLKSPGPLRTGVASTGDLRGDIELAIALRDERALATLKTVDITTAELREAYHSGYIAVDPIAFAIENPDMEAVEAAQKAFKPKLLRFLGGAIALVVVAALVVTQIWGVQPTFLAALGAVLALQIWHFIHVWKTPIQATAPSQADMEAAMKIIAEMNADKK